MKRVSDFNSGKVLALLAVVPLLFACDPVTYGKIVIDSKVPLDACLSKIEQQLRAEGTVKVSGSIADSRAASVTKGSDRISVVLETPASTRVTLSFTWLGRSRAAEERGDFELLDELHATVVRSCGLQQSDLTVQRTCSARLCKKWLGTARDSGDQI